MNDFTTTLLREKFTIRDAFSEQKAARLRDQDSAPVIALSNRMVLPLVWGDVRENLVIRAQNMHSCARMAARIVQEFQDSGPILDRKKPFDWKFAWLSITKGYENKFHPGRWVAV